jgi:hypothetical protein
MARPVPVFNGFVDECGVLTVHNEHGYHTHLLLCAGKPVRVSVTTAKKKRTDPENRYYWGCVIRILAEEFGYTPDEMHLALKYKFVRDGGLPDLPKIGSTANKDTAWFEWYLEQIRIWASTDFGIYIPLPNEVEIPEEA